MAGAAVNIDELSSEDKLALIERLWDSLTPSDVPLTAAQEQELRRRVDRLDREGVSGASLDDVAAAVRARRHR